MTITQAIESLIKCVRYPVSCPSEVLSALGVEEDGRDLNFYQFLRKVVTRSPKRVSKWMPRERAESCFSSAYKKEKFHQTTLLSYYFLQGWLEFILEFDKEGALRRLYVQHPLLNTHSYVELELPDPQREDELEVCCPAEDKKPRRFLDRFTGNKR